MCLIKPCNVLISLPAEIQGLDTNWGPAVQIWQPCRAVPCLSYLSRTLRILYVEQEILCGAILLHREIVDGHVEQSCFP